MTAKIFIYRQRKVLEALFVLLLFLPLLAISAKHSHDWGDDFAGYIHQSINIVNGFPQSETGYLFNPDNFIGPPAYPIGFPLLLTPVYSVYGNSIADFECYMSMWLVVLGVVMFLFFRKHHSFIVSLLLTAIIIYNPWTVAFKSEVLSEVPFTVFMLLTFIFYERRNNASTSFFVAGLLAGFAGQIRSIGYVVLLALIVHQCWKIFTSWRKEGTTKKLFQLEGRRILQFSVPFVFITILLRIIFPLPGGYSKLVDFNSFKSISLDHLQYYLATFNSFFTNYNVGEWTFALIVTSSSMLTFMLVGLAKKFAELVSVRDWFVLFYLLTIIVFPFGNTGFRFLLPISPLLMDYVVVGFNSISIRLPMKKKILAVALALLVLLQYKNDLMAKINCKNCEVNGPQEPTSVEAFDYIRNNTPTHATFLFTKARALSLYTNRSAYSNRKWKTMNDLDEEFQSHHFNFYVIHSEITDDSTKKYFDLHAAQYPVIWSNAKFKILQPLP